ncbi:MAG: HNH endonuclease [Desulfuromonadales bacterium]
MSPIPTINDPALRTQARAIIIHSYFEPNEQSSLWALTGHDAQPTETAGLNIQYIDREAVERGREGRFRIGVVTAYNYTCALTGYRLVTLSSGTIVDACHIHQFAKSRNNDLNNGITLSKNAHLLFDNGLWSLRDDYSVVVAERHFAEAGDSAILLSHMKNKKVTLPADPGQWPALKPLQWHCNHKFLGS